MTEPVLAVSGLRAYYRTSAFGVEREVRAVDDISLSIATNEIYGLAGESSSGKTTLIKTIANAIQPPLKVLAGSVVFNFHGRRVDIHGVAPRELSAIRWKHLSYIMQGSMNVLNPVRRVRHAFFDFAEELYAVSLGPNRTDPALHCKELGVDQDDFVHAIQHEHACLPERAAAP